MDRLKRKLEERYWRLDEYINESWEVLREILKSKIGKMYILFAGLMGLSEIFKGKMSEILLTISVTIVMLMLFFSIKQIMNIIEGINIPKRKILWNKIVINFVLYTIHIIALLLIFSSVFYLFQGLSEDLNIIQDSTIMKALKDVMPSVLVRLSIWIVITVIISISYLLFFRNIYIIRNIKFIDAIKYSAHISKGNRIRLIVPIVIISIFNIVVSLILFYILNISKMLNIQILNYIILIIQSIYGVLFSLYYTILGVLVYLNLEYIDFKNQENELEKEEIVEVLEEKSEKKINVIEKIEMTAEGIKNERFRKTEIKDIEKVLEIIEKAKKEIAKFGIDQWQNGYPEREDIIKDIEDGNSYVLIDNDEVVATIAFSFEEEESYRKLVAGQWLTNGTKYGVIHRIAVDSEKFKRGYAKELMENIEKIAQNENVYSIKIDTHKGNLAMKSYLYKNGFIYCGICHYIEPDGIIERVVFEKILK